ncbi:MAG: hypothetical protein ACLUOI_05845 [Eisenbergiella sp.]
MRAYFHDNAWIKWHNTNELFNVEEFIKSKLRIPRLVGRRNREGRAGGKSADYGSPRVVG